jgi:hypothetical protein
MLTACTRHVLASFAVASLLIAAPGAAQTIVAPTGKGEAIEWRAEFTTTGHSDIAEGSRALGELRHWHARVEGDRSLPLSNDASLRLGAGWRRFDFAGGRADVPESLTALALKIGYTRTFSPRWSLLAEIEPGLYSDFEDISGDDFNAPFGLRLMYAQKRELQWAFAVFVDARSSRPVIGGVGARWQFAPQWTLLAFLPAPRVEYAASSALTLYAGASLQGGTFRVAEDFGRRRGRPILDNQDIGFREITAGAGARWKLKPGLSVNLGLGWMLDRRFEFEERDLLINGDGAPSLTLGASGSF